MGQLKGLLQPFLQVGVEGLVFRLSPGSLLTQAQSGAGANKARQKLASIGVRCSIHGPSFSRAPDVPCAGSVISMTVILSFHMLGVLSRIDGKGTGLPALNFCAVAQDWHAPGRLPTILVVDDDLLVQAFLLRALGESGYACQGCADGFAAASLGSQFDLIILDLTLPGQSGLEVCRQLRGQACRTPILVLTANDELNVKVACLDAGADDYVVKPFQLTELLARVRALLRRNPQLDLPVYRAGNLEVDPGTRLARRGDRAIHLSATEYSLLESLFRHGGNVVSRRTLLLEVWDYDFQGVDNILDVYISYLRSKIDKGERHKLIVTVRNVGYRLDLSTRTTPGPPIKMGSVTQSAAS